MALSSASSLTRAPHRPHSFQGAWRRCPQQQTCRTSNCAAAQQQPQVPSEDPHEVLGVPRGAARAEIRAAYYACMQAAHPDITGRDNSTADAVALNLAYAKLIGAARARSCDGEEEEDQPSVFDVPEAEPTCVFVNPFACGVSPLDWRQLQELVQGQAEPEAALQAAGLYFAYDTAVCWVTPAQLAVLEAELGAMEESLSYELTGYYVTDCLLRARHANVCVTYARSKSGDVRVNN